jgi:hypothetical protein
MQYKMLEAIFNSKFGRKLALLGGEDSKKVLSFYDFLKEYKF